MEPWNWLQTAKRMNYIDKDLKFLILSYPDGDDDDDKKTKPCIASLQQCSKNHFDFNDAIPFVNHRKFCHPFKASSVFFVFSAY